MLFWLILTNFAQRFLGKDQTLWIFFSGMVWVLTCVLNFLGLPKLLFNYMHN